MKIEIDDNYIELETVNLRQFGLYTDSENIVIKYDEQNFIQAIMINDKFKIKLGDEYEIQGIKYKVNIITKSDNHFYCIQERATKTSQFILPLLEFTYHYYDFKNSFYNSYISSDYKALYIVYKFTPTSEYIELEGRLTKHPMFVELIDPDPNTVVVKFNLPQEFIRDIKKIMKGKYSDINPTLKSKICIFHNFGVKTKTFRMLHRDVKLREEMSKEYGFNIPEDVDLMSKPIKEQEIWDFQSILKPVGIPN